MERESGGRAFLDHNHDAGLVWTIDIEAAVSTQVLGGSQSARFEMADSLRDRRVLVVGLGDTGFSCVRWLVRAGCRVRVVDDRPFPPRMAALRRELPEIPLHAGSFQPASLAGIELLVVSPGLPLHHPFIAAATAQGVPVVGDIELFAWTINQLAPARPTLVGITGSNGKSTVTSMVGAMCRAAGRNTVVAGNIGLPVLDALGDALDAGLPEVFVLELSSFQLETTASLRLDAGVVLNVTEDHLDRYATLNDYAAAKARIFLHCGTRLVNRDDPFSRAMAEAGQAQLSFGLGSPAGPDEWGLTRMEESEWLSRGDMRLLNLCEVPLAGRHNAANALAALALCHALNITAPAILEALRRFRGLPHRMEPVAEIDGVTFYDDSKGTNVGASVAALLGMARPVVLIAGGDGKGQNFTPLAGALAARGRALVLIGRDACRIAAAAAASGVPQVHAAGMEEAVRLALKMAQPGDAVLLSPACASFDMFDNYIHRARSFVAAVHKLKEEGPAWWTLEE
jgi:UDP-N-acetylmuramoylalanine--D-glutamate ligase